LHVYPVSTNSNKNRIILGYSYPNEILKFSQRAKGSALAQSIGYAFGFIYLYCFPIALQNISWKYFIINGCWNLLFAVVIWFVFVETKDKTLEEMDELFEGRVLVAESAASVTTSKEVDDEPTKVTAGERITESEIKTSKI
jgi:hypothetical protein